MKVLITGEFCKGSLCSSYYWAFKKMGNEVIYFDEVREYKNSSHLANFSLGNRLLERYFSSPMNNRLIKLIRNFMPDLCIIMKGHHIFPGTLLRIRKDNRLTLFNINADDPFNKNRGASSNNIRNSIKLFDCYFTWSKYLVQKIKGLGTTKVEYLPFGFNPETHFPVEVSAEEKRMLGHQIVFVGNWEQRRERLLSHLKDFDLAIWGTSYWRSRCKDRNLVKGWLGKEVAAEDMSKVINASKISLNILRQQNVGSINMRTFEAPACGGFVLSERSQEAKEFFEEDKETVYFSSPEELREKSKYYLEHEEERKEIAQAGYSRCLSSGYSYLERAKKILKTYEEMN